MKTRNIMGAGRVLVLFSILAFVACDNNDDADAVEIQEDEAAAVVESSVASESYGMTANIEAAVVVADEVESGDIPLSCGQTYSDTYNRSASGANYSYDYTTSVSYLLSCNNNIPATFSLEATTAGTYERLRMSSDDESQIEWTISGLQPSADEVVFNGSYVRTGSQVSKVRNENSFSSTLTIQLTNVVVDKSTRKILSGSATVVFEGMSSTGTAFGYTGSITFNGDETATLVLNSGTYLITF